MLFAKKLNEELELKAEDFRVFSIQKNANLASYRDSLEHFSTNAKELLPKVAKIDDGGALPGDELITNGSFVFQFSESWANHEHAREWAGKVLDKRTTFAADGSQIYAGGETSVPIAAIQIGWFENPHDASVKFEKNAHFEILTPTDLIKDQEEPMNPDIRVEERRYLGEIFRISEFLKKHKGWKDRNERMPLAFFDNPLLVPFSQKGLQQSLLKATIGLVELSLETQVPVVGYVARSFSRDILKMLDIADPGKERSPANLFDGSLLGFEKQGILNKWGYRSCFCYSKRRGLDSFFDKTTARSTIGFVYLATASDSVPARLDLPVWVYEKGLLNEILDVIRAECIIGLGYPYPLESADQMAVIAGRDRDIFFRSLQSFAGRGDFGFNVSRKNASKSRRR